MDQETETKIGMKITKIKPKTNFEEAFVKITANFAPLYELLDKRITYMDNVVKKRFSKRSDKALALELALLLEGEKSLFIMCEDHSKFIYGIRDIVAEYGNAIEMLGNHVLELSKKSTDKQLTNKIIDDLVGVKNKLDKITETQNSQSMKIGDTRNFVEDFVKAEERFWEQSAKRKEKRMKNMDEIDVLNKALEEYNHAKRLKIINQELYDHLTGSIYYLFKYSEKYNIQLPKKQELIQMVEKSNFYIDQFAKQPKSNSTKTTDNETEPEMTPAKTEILV